MTDNTDPTNAPGTEAARDGYATASKSLQNFAAEMQRMSKEAMDHTARVAEKLRNAKTVEEAVTIQTSFMQQSFASYADYTRRFSELMMAMPMEFAKQGQAAFLKGSEAVSKKAEQAGEQIQRAASTSTRQG